MNIKYPIAPVFLDEMHLSDNSLEAVLEPLDGLALGDLVAGTDMGLGASTLGDTLTRTGHAAVKVHSVDTNTRVILDTQVNVFADTEAEVAGLGEVALPQLVFLDLEASLENLLSLGATDGDVHGNLFVTTDTEGTDGVAGLAVNRGLTAQLLEHLSSTSESVTRFADRNVEHELLDAQLAHGVGALVLSFRHGDGVVLVDLLDRR